MSVRLLLTDEAWAEIAPILTAIKSRAGSPPALSDRLFIEAVLYLARTGPPWRDLPAEFGHWDAVYNRFRRWEARGIWRQLWERLQTEASPTTRHLFIDATIVRAHQHAGSDGLADHAADLDVGVRTAMSAFDEPGPWLGEAPWDLVLAADVLYEQRNVAVLLWLLPRLVDTTGEVWLADPGRPSLPTFLTGVDALGWRRDELPADPGIVTIHRLRPATQD